MKAKTPFVMVKPAGCRTPVPVADIKGFRPGPTVTVTAGMDGDEYAGIMAAYQLGLDMSPDMLAGRLIIVAIANARGFAAETSLNPEDGKYPKLVGLGKPKGSDSEKLVDWIVRRYVAPSSLWLDLHGPAITEDITPFLWTYVTGNPIVDTLTHDISIESPYRAIVRERVGKRTKPGILAAQSCGYVIAESGTAGTASEDDVARHMLFVRIALYRMGMAPKPTYRHTTHALYSGVREAVAAAPGIWERRIKAGDSVAKNEILGTVSPFTMHAATDVRSPCTGTVLWSKVSPSSRKNDTYAGVGIPL